MDATDPLEHLPVAYARCLRMERAGATPAQIAAALDIPPEAVPMLSALARDKLAALRDRTGTEPADGPV